MKYARKLFTHKLFSKTRVQPNPKHWKPFGCSVYVLYNSLQVGCRLFHKWKQISNVVIYLSQSPQNFSTLELVLDHQTTIVSLRFHVMFDLSFHTCKKEEFELKWQLTVGFITQRGDRTKENGDSTNDLGFKYQRNNV